MKQKMHFRLHVLDKRAFLIETYCRSTADPLWAHLFSHVMDPSARCDLGRFALHSFPTPWGVSWKGKHIIWKSHVWLILTYLHSLYVLCTCTGKFKNNLTKQQKVSCPKGIAFHCFLENKVPTLCPTQHGLCTGYVGASWGFCNSFVWAW